MDKKLSAHFCHHLCCHQGLRDWGKQREGHIPMTTSSCFCPGLAVCTAPGWGPPAAAPLPRSPVTLDRLCRMPFHREWLNTRCACTGLLRKGENSWSYAANHVIPEIKRIFPSIFSLAVRLSKLDRTKTWKVCPWDVLRCEMPTASRSSSDTCLGNSTWKQTKAVKVRVWNAPAESRRLFSKGNALTIGTSKWQRGKLCSSPSHVLPEMWEVWSLLWWISTCYTCQRGHSEVQWEGWGRKGTLPPLLPQMQLHGAFIPLQWHPNPC